MLNFESQGLESNRTAKMVNLTSTSENCAEYVIGTSADGMYWMTLRARGSERMVLR